MQRLHLERFGPIAHADLELGDLTILVGPQATGKSVVLQTLKAVLDMDSLVGALKRNGYHWEEDRRAFLELLYGEGMSTLLGPRSRLEVDGHPWDVLDEADGAWNKRSRREPRLFYVPAQRVLTLQQGWPGNFGSFDIGAPFVVKQFSEDIRLQLEGQFANGHLFPVPGRWKQEIRDLVAEAVFNHAEVRVDSSRLRKRVVLQVSPEAALPFLSWSAGQREFIPLMLGLYWLMPTQGSNRRSPLEWAIVEEPEMGLHPAAISGVALLLLDLLERGYRVVVSTHSPHLLEMVWALKHLQVELAHDPNPLARLFDTAPTAGLRDIAQSLPDKSLRVYALSRGDHGAVAKDISSLDASSADPDVANWGGLTDLADRAYELVASSRLL